MNHFKRMTKTSPYWCWLKPKNIFYILPRSLWPKSNQCKQGWIQETWLQEEGHWIHLHIHNKLVCSADKRASLHSIPLRSYQIGSLYSNYKCYPLCKVGYEFFRSLPIASRFSHGERISCGSRRKTIVVLVLVSRFFPSEWQNECHLSWRVVVAVVASQRRRLISWSLNLKDISVVSSPREKLRFVICLLHL